eukprot:365372-Chlamydomonas_euryale.AAC.5
MHGPLHTRTCSSAGHMCDSPTDAQGVDSQRFHTNSQLGRPTGRSLGNARVTSRLSQKKWAPSMLNDVI